MDEVSFVSRNKLSPEREERKQIAESSLIEFIGLVHPKRLLGNIHKELIGWSTRQDAKSHQLILLPRDHMKSAYIAYKSVWRLTKAPTLRIFFISSTSILLTKRSEEHTSELQSPDHL